VLHGNTLLRTNEHSQRRKTWFGRELVACTADRWVIDSARDSGWTRAHLTKFAHRWDTNRRKHNGSRSQPGDGI